MSISGETNYQITESMIDAGIEAAEFEGYEWGWDHEKEIVIRVYLAMAREVVAEKEPESSQLQLGTHN